MSSRPALGCIASPCLKNRASRLGRRQHRRIPIEETAAVLKGCQGWLGARQAYRGVRARRAERCRSHVAMCALLSGSPFRDCC